MWSISTEPLNNGGANMHRRGRRGRTSAGQKGRIDLRVPDPPSLGSPTPPPAPILPPTFCPLGPQQGAKPRERWDLCHSVQCNPPATAPVAGEAAHCQAWKSDPRRLAARRRHPSNWPLLFLDALRDDEARKEQEGSRRRPELTGGEGQGKLGSKGAVGELKAQAGTSLKGTREARTLLVPNGSAIQGRHCLDPTASAQCRGRWTLLGD